MKTVAAALASFVYLSAVDPSIEEQMLYGTTLNFTGAPLVGYEVPRALLTRKAATALKRAQEIFRQKGFSLVIYDAYRPQRTQTAFKKWSLDPYDNTQMKEWFYPEHEKSTLFDKGYIFETSSHSRGSTIDCTIIPLGKKTFLPRPEKRTLKNGETIVYLNDGSVDMGTSFDFFGAASWTDSPLISKAQRKNRTFMREILESCGFINYSLEWWHFTYKDEPFPDTYFDFSFDELNTANGL